MSFKIKRSRPEFSRAVNGRHRRQEMKPAQTGSKP
jgi:hypothetical protein